MPDKHFEELIVEQKPVEFKLIETDYSARNEMIERNEKGLIDIYDRAVKGELTAVMFIKLLGEELVKNRVIVDDNMPLMRAQDM